MNFDGAKENIQPLAAGRNVEQLEVALNAESHQECQEELLQQRKQIELDISNYVGDDPLELWFEYVSWVEQSYPKSGKEAALDDVLKTCLARFEKDQRYAQDPRFIRLFIKYIDTKKSPDLYYTRLYNSGVGTMVADLYIAWAHYFDILDDFEQAKTVYQKGLDARAAPIEHLKQIYERFQFSVGQRIIRKEDYRQEFLSTMEAQRNAFTSLRGLKRTKVGSIRTGSAVKSFTPGQVRQNQSQLSSSSSNAPLNVYDGAKQPAAKPPPQQYRSVVEEIENSTVENTIEPGPWSKASSRKSVFHNVHQNSALKLAILEDDIEQPPIKFGRLPPDNGNLGINLPKNFVRKNDPQTSFALAAYVEDVVDVRTIPSYPKFYLHPNANVCFQPEELRQYHRLKDQNISNNFTKAREKFWGIGSTVGIRVSANFPRQNQTQTDMETERPDISLVPSHEHFECDLAGMYPKDSKTEFQIEEIARDKWASKRDSAGEMDETVCVRGRQSFGVRHIRKSIVSSGRKSIMPSANVSVRQPTPMNDDSDCSDMDIDDGDVQKEKASVNDKVVEFLKPAEIPKPKAAFLSDKSGELGKPSELPKTTQWSVFADDELNTLGTPPEQMSNKMVQSPAIFPSTGVNATDQTPKEIFAVPQRPIPRTVERRTSELLSMKQSDIPAAIKPPYPIGPQTGAVRKSILRKSTISEHAVENPVDHLPMNAYNTNENTGQSAPPDLDYSLCTQAFNFNLAEQMASTPVSIRRTEALTERVRAPDIQPIQPLKLSTIMETTEGSASTKSSTQFSSPEDDDLSKRSNVANRTKFAGTTVCSDDEATGACKNYSKSEPIQELSVNSYANNVAGLTNNSCNVERTLPAIQLSVLPDVTPVAQNKSVARTATVVKDGPSKNYPFTIFEDTQTTSTIASFTPLPKGLAVHLAPLVYTTDPKMPSTNEIQISTHLTDGRFNETSMWIKDEPKSFTLTNESAVEESFVVPDVCSRETLVPALSTTADEIYVKIEGAASHQAQSEQQMDNSSAEESFAIPNFRQRKSLASLLNMTVDKNFDKVEGAASHQGESEQQMDSPPNIRLRKSIAPPLNMTVGEIYDKIEGAASHQAESEQQMDIPSTEESFVLPNIRLRKSIAPPLNMTVGEIYDKIEGAASHQAESEQPMDSPSTEESFALPNIRLRKSIAPPLNMTVDENYDKVEGAASHQGESEQQMDSPSTEESFALPNIHLRKSKGPPLNTSETCSTFEGFESNEVKEEPMKMDGPAEESFAQISSANRTFELDDSSDSEEEVIEVPDETLIEDAPKIVHVQSLANQNNISENRFETSTRISISFTEDEMAVHMNKRCEKETANCDQSIYFKQNSILVEPSWMEKVDRPDLAERNPYQYEEVNLEESRMVIDSKLAEQFVDPFNEVLKNAILSEVQFIESLKECESCELISRVPTVAAKRSIPFKDTNFDVLKCIGHGAYGRVYSVKGSKDGTTYAVKKEMPANLWEYYILKEVESRVVGNLTGYMKIDMAIIANDGSLLFSDYSQYGTLLDVCNRVFSSMQNNINESIVFILAYQILDLVDRLHKADILHLDLKPDNFLVMRPLSTNHQQLFLKLIDFGNAVDLRQYRPGQQFNAALETKHFVCIEMLEGRPWLYQPDFYCLASTIHSVLFGKYMDVRKVKENYAANIRIPRYFNAVWSRFFSELINIPENTSPNLQALKQRFHEVIVIDNKLEQKIVEFNKFIH